MPINSKQKGKRRELEFTKVLKSWGFTKARRGQQFKGTPDSPDIEGIPGVHFEVKGVERLNVWAAMEQASADAGLTDVPVVAWKKNGKPWLLVVRADHVFDLSKALVPPKEDTSEVRTMQRS